VTVDEYRKQILYSETAINFNLENDQVAHWKRFQRTMGITVSYSDWNYYHEIMVDITKNAQERMRCEADAIEKQYYDELEED
jgi:hypothetical protein